MIRLQKQSVVATFPIGGGGARVGQGGDGEAGLPQWGVVIVLRARQCPESSALSVIFMGQTALQGAGDKSIAHGHGAAQSPQRAQAPSPLGTYGHPGDYLPVCFVRSCFSCRGDRITSGRRAKHRTVFVLFALRSSLSPIPARHGNINAGLVMVPVRPSDPPMLCESTFFVSSARCQHRSEQKGGVSWAGHGSGTPRQWESDEKASARFPIWNLRDETPSNQRSRGGAEGVDIAASRKGP